MRDELESFVLAPTHMTNIDISDRLYRIKTNDDDYNGGRPSKHKKQRTRLDHSRSHVHYFFCKR